MVATDIISLARLRREIGDSPVSCSETIISDGAATRFTLRTKPIVDWVRLVIGGVTIESTSVYAPVVVNAAEGYFDIAKTAAEETVIEAVFTSAKLSNEDLLDALEIALKTRGSELTWDSLPDKEYSLVMLLAKYECYMKLASQYADKFPVQMAGGMIVKHNMPLTQYLALARELKSSYEAYLADPNNTEIVVTTVMRESRQTGQRVPYFVDQVKHVLNQEVIVGENLISVTWQPYLETDFHKYEVLLNGVPSAILDPHINWHTFSPVDLATVHTVQVRLVTANGLVLSAAAVAVGGEE